MTKYEEPLELRSPASPDSSTKKYCMSFDYTTRLRDFADVQDLIAALNLPLDLEMDLDESVRGEYRRLWGSVQKGKHNPQD